MNLLNLVIDMKQIITLTFELKLPIIFPCLLMNFYVSQDSFKDMVDEYVDDISLTDEEIKHIEYSTMGQQSFNLW